MSWLFGPSMDRFYEHRERMARLERDRPPLAPWTTWRPASTEASEAIARGRAHGRRQADLEHSVDLVEFGLFLTGGAMTRGDVERELGKWREQR